MAEAIDITEQSHIKEIFKDIFKYAPSKVCGMLGNALIVPVYTSILSTEQYGLYSLSIALLSFLCILFSDWIGLSGLRFFRQNQLTNSVPKYLTTLITLLIINLSVMFGIAFIFRESFFAFFKVSQEYFIAILLLIIPVAIRALLFQLLRAQLKSVAFTFSTILNQIMTILLSVFFVKVYHMGAIALLLGMAISISITDIILIFQSGIGKDLKPNVKIEWTSLIPIFNYGIPIAATSLSAWIINQSNKFIMNSIHGFREVGIVGVAYGLTLPLLMTIFATITVAVIPRVINLYEENYDVKPIISKFIGYYVLIALPLVSTMALFANDYVRVFSSNPNFYSASVIIPFFAFGTFFLALTDYTTLQYHLAKKTEIDFILKLISGILGIILNIILIPKLSLVGVGLATLSANFCYVLLSMVIILPGMRIEYPKEIFNRIILAFVPYLLVSLFVVNHLLLTPAVRMLFVLIVFHASYWFIGRLQKS